MGRKIPGKKHKGVKDPEKQRAIKFKSIKDKINAPPKSLDQQEIPESLRKIIDFKEKLKAGKVQLKRKRKKKSNLISSESNLNPDSKKFQRLQKRRDAGPIFVQQHGESDNSFLRRVDETVENIIKETEYETKHDIKINRNAITGEIQVDKQSKDELKEMIKEAKRKERMKGRKKKKINEPVLTKSQKRKMKLTAKKEKQVMEKINEFDDYKDSVQFGEVVHGPPTLVAPKKVVKNDCAPRPGKKDLLLKSVFEQNEKKLSINFPQIEKRKTVFDKIENTGKIDKTGKRKNLPAALRRQLENHRNEVINAYRLQKAKKNSNPVI